MVADRSDVIEALRLLVRAGWPDPADPSGESLKYSLTGLRKARDAAIAVLGDDAPKLCPNCAGWGAPEGDGMTKCPECKGAGYV